MESERSSDYIEKNTKSIVGEGIKKLNLFTILQVALLFELYYLGANSILKFINDNNNGKIVVKIPPEIEQYNTLILGYFEKWNSFVLFLIISMFICGISFIFLTKIPKIKNYNIISVYSGYGLYASGWLIIIYITYILYNNIGIFFLITPIVLGIFFIFIDDIKIKIKNYKIVRMFYPKSQEW
ncbi:hypothetical protein [Clostridium tertium]|uniref:hypothetical protein n=1 Tax=Clostridium tertium TaxID=1559 RepID=UPI00356A9C39